MAQAILAFDAHPADRATGFELGRDHARHALTPPLDHLAPGSPLRQGWEAGRASFGARTLAPTRPVRQWLHLRLSAWRRGRAFEGVQVTPNYLRQIDVAHCPITRQTLTHRSGGSSDACIDRVRSDAGYAAGNLAVMSTRASLAKGRSGFDEVLSLMRLAEAEAPGLCDLAATGPDALGGLAAAEWARIAVLCSFVTPLPHEQAAGLPLPVLPPNRLRLFNPIQALQALVTRQLGRPGWSARIARIADLLPGKPVRRDFQVFVHALLPRVLEAGRPADAQATRWALEDAWRDQLVQRCWMRFSRQLNAAQAEQIVLGASALGLGAQTAQSFTPAQATEGWALEHGGYLAAPCGRVAMAAKALAAPPRSEPIQLALSA